MDEHTKEIITNVQSSHDNLVDDGGWKSRKFWGFVLTMVLIFSGGILGCFNRFANFDLSTIVDGLIVTFSIMCGINVATKFNAASVMKSIVHSVSENKPCSIEDDKSK